MTRDDVIRMAREALRQIIGDVRPVLRFPGLR